MVRRAIAAVARGASLATRPRRDGVVAQVDRSDPGPVVLVHGYLDGPGTPWWARLTGHLAEAGWAEDRVSHVESSLVSGVSLGSPRRYADDVRAALERAHDRHGEPVNLLCHSMGGLTARWCLEQGDGAALVEDIVTLGTPHQGTYAAYLGVLTAGGRSMLPSSSVIETLTEGGLEPSVRYTAVASRGDRAVVPTSNALVPEALAVEDTENVAVASRSHVELVSDPAVVSTYVDRLA